MKKLLLLFLIVITIFGYQRFRRPAALPEESDVQAFAETEPGSGVQVKQAAAFQCDGRIYCSQMTSCEEAKYFLAHCPGVRMDNHGHGDGIPCERQWCVSR